MLKIRILPQFIIRERDIEYLESLPPNTPTTCYTKAQKKQIGAIYTRYITKNSVMKDHHFEIYLSEKKAGWPNKVKMTTESAMLRVLDTLIDLLNRPEITLERLAQDYRQALLLPEAYRILISHIYDFR